MADCIAPAGGKPGIVAGGVQGVAGGGCSGEAATGGSIYVGDRGCISTGLAGVLEGAIPLGASLGAGNVVASGAEEVLPCEISGVFAGAPSGAALGTVL